MRPIQLMHILTYTIATTWIVNGLFCKVLNLVPRHREIVAEILGSEHAGLLTTLIGFGEISIGIWVLTLWWPKLNTIVQIILVATMNALEFTLVPHLLLWGKMNAFFAFLFILVVYFHGQLATKKLEPTS